jgi:uncharacterized protein (TIGR02058 family)
LTALTALAVLILRDEPQIVRTVDVCQCTHNNRDASCSAVSTFVVSNQTNTIVSSFHTITVRACRNAIEFNQIPSIASIVPGGRDGMKLDVLLAVPEKYQADLDLEAIRAVFPYGQIRFQIQVGGMIATSGLAIAELGDKNEDMVVVCVAVTVGY